MFTGIIETLGTVQAMHEEGSNITFSIRSAFAHELKVDQSIAHNGVCLTVTEVNPANHTHKVTAIAETLQKTNLGALYVGDKVNLERCLKIGDRMDGHWVQGHVDQTGICIDKKDLNGSWLFTFEYDPGHHQNITVEKGSICINGVSLTVVQANPNIFSVAIIPYTYEHTNFHNIKIGTVVNLEFDILGKYIAALLQARSV